MSELVVAFLALWVFLTIIVCAAVDAYLDMRRYDQGRDETRTHVRVIRGVYDQDQHP